MADQTEEKNIAKQAPKQEVLPKHLQPPPKVGAAKGKKDYSALIAEYEKELDDLHPNWRSANAAARQYHNFETEIAERICWLINRLDRLKRGMDIAMQVLWSPQGLPFAIPQSSNKRGRK